MACPNGSRFQVFDVSNPAAPALLSSFRPANQALSVAVRGNRAYVGGFSEVAVFDISGTTPVQVGSLSGGSNLRRLLVRGTVLYVASASSNEMQAARREHRRASPARHRGHRQLAPTALALNGTSLYTVNVGSNNLQTIDVTVPANPSHPERRGHRPAALRRGREHGTVAVVVNQTSYAGNSTGSLQVFRLTSVGRTVTVNPDGSLGSIPAVGDNQQLSISGNTVSLTNGGSVSVPDAQQLSISGSTISLSNGGSVVVPSSRRQPRQPPRHPGPGPGRPPPAAARPERLLPRPALRQPAPMGRSSTAARAGSWATGTAPTCCPCCAGPAPARWALGHHRRAHGHAARRRGRQHGAV